MAKMRKSHRTRWGRYIEYERSKEHDGKIDILFSHDSHSWHVTSLTRHELIKLRKLIDKILKDENLQ